MQNGAIFVSMPESLYNKILPYIMPLLCHWKRSIDIDNESDLKLARLIIENEKNKNRR